MVPVNSAQREPSMEEILASIRRIIEDSDTTRKSPDGEGESAAPLNGGEVSAFRAELGGEKQPEPLAAAEGETSVASPAIEGPAVHSWGYGAPAPAFEQPLAGFPPDAESSAMNEGGAAGTRADVAVEVDLDMDDLEPAGLNGAHFAMAPQAQPLEPDAERPESDAAKPAIISAQAGRQVAASFGDLSDAFAARSRRSFDDIAQEMMRPMLQDWLDNNLPHLVERLVREEIERIARGAGGPR